MTFISAESIFERLGISWTSMLFHLVNIVILVVALYFLLYKPVKKIIYNHRQKLKDIFEENKKLNEDALEMQHKYEGLMEDAKQEAMRVSAAAAEKAQEKSDEIIRHAQAQAENIISGAKKDAEASKIRLKNEFRDSVSKAAVDIAGKVLEREVSEKDNKDIIDACLKEWDE